MSAGSCGVPDMTSISDIDEDVINRNLQTRYSKDHIYVSFLLDMVYFNFQIYYSKVRNIIVKICI